MSAFSGYQAFGASRGSQVQSVLPDDELHTPSVRPGALAPRSGGGTSGSNPSPLGGGWTYTPGGSGTSTVSPGLRYRPGGWINSNFPGMRITGGMPPGGGGAGSLLNRSGTRLGGGGFLEQAGDVLGRETEALQGAANRQFQRNTNATRGVEGVVNRAGEFQQLGEQEASRLEDVSGGLDRRFEEAAAETLGRFDTNFADDMAAAVAGVRRGVQGTLNAIRNGLGPEGTVLTAAEQRDRMFALEQSVGEQVQTVYTSLSSAFNNARASLATNLNAQRLQSFEGVRAMQSMASNIRTAAQAAALQFEVQGRTQVADMIYRNPESVVSYFNALMGLASVATAPGGRSIPAVPLGGNR